MHSGGGGHVGGHMGGHMGGHVGGHVGGHAVNPAHHHSHESHDVPGYIPAGLGQVPGQVQPGRRVPASVQRLGPSIALLALIILALVLFVI